MHHLTRVTPPAEQPVDLASLKSHAVVDFADDDALLQSYLDAAVDHLDGPRGLLGRCIVTQTWRADLDGWADPLRIPVPDVASVTLSYRDAAGVTQTVDGAASYYLVTAPYGAELRFRSGWLRPGVERGYPRPVSVEFTAGFGAAAEVPDDIKVAILQLAAHWYERRSAAGEDAAAPEPFAFRALLAKYRRPI